GGGVVRDGLPDLGITGGGGVAGIAVPHGLIGRVHDVLRSLEVRLADLTVDDTAALGLQGVGLRQDLKSGFRVEPAHAAGDSVFEHNRRPPWMWPPQPAEGLSFFIIYPQSVWMQGPAGSTANKSVRCKRASRLQR